VKNLLKENEKSFLRACIECEKPEMEIIDDDMATITCPSREMNVCWKNIAS
jgi:hypothetical protein